MAKWRIYRVLVSTEDPTALDKLDAIGMLGWEPYAIVGVTHYFKTCDAQVRRPEEIIKDKQDKKK